MSTFSFERTPLQWAQSTADAQGNMAGICFKKWLEAHRRLALLRMCPRYEFFANNPLQVNALILKDMRCKPLRECLQEVLKLQRELQKWKKTMREMVKKEREYDAQFWAIAATMRK